MSKFIDEDEKYIHLYRYLHDEPDEFSEWERGEDNVYGSRYSQKVHEAEHYAFYEVRVDYKINKATGEVTYLGIR